MKTFLALSVLISTFFLTWGQSDETWTLSTDAINPSRYFGVTAANGMIGLVSSAHPTQVSEIILNGVFDTYGRGRVSNILKGFNFANLDVQFRPDRGMELDDDRTPYFTLDATTIQGYKQHLDMRKAVFISEFDVQDLAHITYTFRALRHLPFTSMIEIDIEAKSGVQVGINSEMLAPDILRDVENTYQVINRPHVKVPLMTSYAQSPTGKHTLAASSTFLTEDAADILKLVHEEWDYGRHFTRIMKEIPAGAHFRFTVLASEVSTEHYSDPINEAERLTLYAALEGRERLLQRHEAAWDKLWESDILIEGDRASQREVRSALYHLYAFVREGTAYSPSPMGLSGLGYNGHAFWDTELWMFPPLLMLQPEMAKSLLEYRYERLGAAQQNARAHGYRGAMYPWESDDVGQEATPVWALTGPFEHHISGCISVACWDYYRVTGDKAWLASRGYPMMKEVADFWVSRVERDERGNCHIYNVVGADEYAENVDDNAFTNGVAISALRYATRAAEALGSSPDPVWAEIANCIPILRFEDGTTQEYAGYAGKMIKQADVNLLAYPLEVIGAESQIRQDLTYYEPLIDEKNGPAMGYAALSVLYSRLGEPKKAFRLFEKSYIPNRVPPFGALAEAPGGTNPYFATGAGGLLQAVIHGFGGLDATDEGIKQLDTRLPSAWKSLTITGVGPQEQTFTVEK